ncbi:MAG: hypothetical protein QW478_05645 [Candidatus Micrarchaeaceae archaeon]
MKIEISSASTAWDEVNKEAEDKRKETAEMQEKLNELNAIIEKRNKEIGTLEDRCKKSWKTS